MTLAITEQMTAAALDAIDKQPEELTDTEKVALAYFAGLPYRVSQQESGKIRIDIVPQFFVTKKEGRFKVYYLNSVS